eukprot:7291615-Prymnesium_polylepis.2
MLCVILHVVELAFAFCLADLVRGDLYRIMGNLYRCTLDVCSTLEIDTACREEGFTAATCPKGRSAMSSARHEFSRVRRQMLIAEYTQRWELQQSLATELDALPMEFVGEVNNTFVEGTHAALDGPGSGFWFYFAKGSGVYVNLGSTVSFPSHGGAWT